MKYVTPNRRTSGRKPEAEKRRLRATVAPAASAGLQPAMRALEWNIGMAR